MSVCGLWLYAVRFGRSRLALSPLELVVWSWSPSSQPHVLLLSFHPGNTGSEAELLQFPDVPSLQVELLADRVIRPRKTTWSCCMPPSRITFA